jgi:hypothetical protein
MLGVSSPRKLPDALPPPLDTRSIQFLNVLAGWYKDREMAQLSSINHETRVGAMDAAPGRARQRDGGGGAGPVQ